MARKILDEVPSRDINNVIADKFDAIRRRYSLNLDSVFSKSIDRAFDIGLNMNPNASTKKTLIKSKLKALKDVMLNDIDNIKNESSQDLARTVASAYATGSSSGQIKKQLSDDLGKIDYKVDRAIRTNTAYLSSLAKLKTWEAMGFEEYQWVLGKRDKATRPEHAKIHNKVFKIRDALNGISPCPGHWMENGKINLSQSINCRCGLRLHK